jgi:RNA polymerase sigma-70 factor (ECF subfamily)
LDLLGINIFLTVQKDIASSQLLDRLIAGDRKALASLYDAYHEALYGTAFYILKDAAIAEEVIQDVFVKIWKNAASYQSKKGTLFTWMINITRYTALDKLKTREISQRKQTDEIPLVVHNIEHQYQEEQMVDAIGVRELLDKVSNEQRQVLEWVYFEGYSHSEISEEKNIPLGTVKTRLRSALKKLRGLIQ